MLKLNCLFIAVDIKLYNSHFIILKEIFLT